MRKIILKIYNFFYALFGGMANAETIIFRDSGKDSNSTTINQKVTSNRVSEDLLKGELTQEVKELRYRTYKVDREAKQYEYFSPTLAKKTNEKDDSIKENSSIEYVKKNSKQYNRFAVCENDDNLEIITIQENKRHVETVYEVMYSDKKVQIPKYTIDIKRNYIPKFLIESFAKRIVLKKIDDGHTMIDIYVSIYRDPFDLKSKPFLTEIKKIINENIKSDITNFDNLSFTTSHAYKLSDMLRFTFKYVNFINIKEFDGNYIIKFKGTNEEFAFDLTNQYYSKSMDEKYKNKEKKNIDLQIDGGDVEEEYICAECGKVIKYSTKNINNMDISPESNGNTNNTEYYDLQISEQTFGKKLCHDCLNKLLNKMENGE